MIGAKINQVRKLGNCAFLNKKNEIFQKRVRGQVSGCKGRGQVLWVVSTAGQRKLAHTQTKSASMQLWLLIFFLQSLCQYFSEEFNKKNPPKKVEFVDCHLIECIERPGACP